MNTKRFTSLGISLLFTSVASVFAQPEKRLDTTGVVNAACPLNSNPADTLNLPVDDSGFTKIFDGKSLKGWWENCQSSHSSNDRTYGGFWLVDSVNGFLFANNNAAGNAGSILMTNKLYGNYELIFDLWPSFGDDGGVFNRTTANGTCYQTTVDYIGGSSVGGVYFENSYTGGGRNYDPFTFGANKYTVTIGTNTTATNTWTYITKNYSNPTDYGCPSTGCVPANWTTVWDTGGWNQMRVKFFGTGASASSKVHNYAWIRKFGAPNWVPTIMDSVQYNTPNSYLGFQIHGGGSWTNKSGHWYRNIKLRPLTDQGDPIIKPTSVVSGASTHFDLHATSGALVGSLDSDHEITISDLSGRVLERFSGHAGAIRHAFTTQARGILMVTVKTAGHVAHNRVFRIFE